MFIMRCHQSIKKVRLILFFFVLSHLSVPPAFAWNSNTHQVIASIAWEEMQPQTRERVIALLLQAPPDSGISELFPNDSRPLPERQREFFLNASIWADLVRAPSNKERKEKYSHPNWHYTMFLWKEENGIPVDVNQPPADENIVERLYFFQDSLTSKKGSPDSQAVALAWVLHLVGDIHQPLHVSSKVTDETVKNDLGGNRFMLDERNNLHSYWDKILDVKYHRELSGGRIDGVANLIKKRQPKTRMLAYLKLRRFAQWAREGYECARTSFYPKSLKENQRPQEEYVNWSSGLAEAAIALAGYRLGYMLNSIYGSADKAQEVASASAQEDETIEANLKFKTICVAEKFNYQARNIQEVKGTLANGKNLSGYDASQVVSIIKQAKSELLNALQDKKLSGMKAYVDKFFPEPANLVTYRVMTQQTSLRSDIKGRSSRFVSRFHASSVLAEERVIATFESANVALNRSRNFLNEVIANSDMVTVKVESLPETGANVVLKYPDVTDPQHSTSTDAPISGIFRGIYVLKVTKAGFKPINQQINLWTGVSRIICELTRETQAGEAQLCKPLK